MKQGAVVFVPMSHSTCIASHLGEVANNISERPHILPHKSNGISTWDRYSEVTDDELLREGLLDEAYASYIDTDFAGMITDRSEVSVCGHTVSPFSQLAV